jgi:hypothetical protein
MDMKLSLRVFVGLLASGVLCSCAGAPEGGDCESHYSPVASAPTWGALRDAMLASEEWGSVAAVRTQARGDDVGAGSQSAVRVVDLLDGNGHRLAQVDVWRTDAGAWSAGVWNQCID